MSLYKHSKILNTSGLFCYTSPQKFILQRRIQKSLNKQRYFMVIDRATSNIEIIQKNTDRQKKIEEESINIEKSQQVSKRTFSACIGNVKIFNFKFLVFVDQVKVVSAIDTLQIFEIHSLFFLCYNDEKILKRHLQKSQIYKKLRELNSLLTYGFYFSYQHGLTRSLQYQNLPVLNKFAWNIRLLEQFKPFSQEYKRWFSPIIQGFVNSFEVILEGSKIQYLLISRRSTTKPGTRYFDRGMNEEGYVANYVQTEQIVKIEDYKISDIQIRGNVPIFFEQKGLTTKIQIIRGYQLAHKTYIEHFKKLKHQYLKIFIINLLSTRKTGEKNLTQQFERHLKDQKDNAVKYMYFNFHDKCHNNKFQNADEGVNQVKQMKINLRYLILDGEKVIERPAGVFRTNCLDCLDRTNFFQAKLALLTLQNILELFKIKFQTPLIQIMNDPLNEMTIIKKFRTIWADNGDMISYHYTGTGSTHTDITRDGQRGWLGTFKHKYKSITRFYNQNFSDFYKMEQINMLLNGGQFKKKQANVMKEMEQRQGEYCRKQLVQIYIFTWKVPKQVPPSLMLFPNTPGLIVINLQQADSEQKWKKLINQSIDNDKYILVAEKTSNNNIHCIYAKIQLKQSISEIQLTKVKFKSIYNSYFASKCAIIIRLSILSTKIVFIGCQLQYGRDNIEGRISNLKEIHQYGFLEESVGQKKSYSFIRDEVIFLFGNVNTNISAQFKNAFVQFEKTDKKVTLENRRLMKKMLETDQFEYIKKILISYRDYEEQQIKFPPNYCLINNQYDSQKSGWPDRIWFSKQKNTRVQCTQYNVIDGIKGHHLPVFGMFQVQCQQINHIAKETVMRQLALSLSPEIDGSQQQGSIQSEEDQQGIKKPMLRNLSEL